ncbi:possible alpha/beta hydrolase superfamily [Geminocystis sp. NIES-3708]|uniref:alpha/beta fold hydrolase n=1 Tax=Geminocystis sp. NIES-3708 TaxID=1615909 RepID=UPI0005FCB81D|nr:alpha/beta hydrolase [Geminocystis sp. NIES-3708]BAQ60555.1 possible alpha/beta hydrolase superfamily [Geminocystis sp. NIES-3708]
MNKINIRGVNHYYEFTKSESYDSSKPILVFIHGWLLSGQYWTPLIDQLKHQYSCLVYDLRGFGASQILSSSTEESDEKNQLLSKNKSFSLHSYAEDLKELLTQLNIQNAWLIGHSLGGSIALWGADICSDIVEGVICVNAGGGIYLQEEFERFRKAGENLVKFRPQWLLKIPFFDFIFAIMMVKKPLKLRWGKQRLKDFLFADEKAAIGSLLESTTEDEVHYLPQIVARLNQPVYFIAGKQDQIMETQYVKHLASFHTLFQHHQQNVYEINDCGHFAMLEQTKLVAEYTFNIIQSNKIKINPNKMLR